MADGVDLPYAHICMLGMGRWGWGTGTEIDIKRRKENVTELYLLVEFAIGELFDSSLFDHHELDRNIE